MNLISAVGYRISETSSGFRVGERTAEGVGGLIAIFRDISASASEIFVLASGLGTGLSFYGVWTLS